MDGYGRPTSPHIDAFAQGAIELRSDNSAGVAPQILHALASANDGGVMAYGGDRWSEELREVVAGLAGGCCAAGFAGCGTATTTTCAVVVGLSPGDGGIVGATGADGAGGGFLTMRCAMASLLASRCASRALAAASTLAECAM